MTAFHWGFTTVTDPLVHVALWSGMAALATSLLLLALILLLRIRLVAQRRRRRRVLARFRPLLAEALLEVPAHLPVFSGRDREVLVEEWNHAVESIRGQARKRLIELARRLGLNAQSRRMLSRGSHSERLRAAVALGHLHDRAAVEALRELVDRGVPSLAVTAACALLELDPETHAKTVLAALSRHPEWPLPRLGEALAETGPDGCRALSTILRRATPRQRPRLIRLLDVMRCPEADSLLAAILDHTGDAEVTAAALQALQDPAQIDRVRARIDHEAWYVRLQAASALGRLGTQADVPALLGLLSDPEWWVRYRAAQALAAMPFIDRGALTRLRDGHTDPFARDMLTQVLSEMEAG